MNGTRFFSQGDYAHALTEFQAAYELAPVPAVLYNIAVTFEQLGRAREALDTYVEYRASGPPKERIADVTAKIARLKQTLGVP